MLNILVDTREQSPLSFPVDKAKTIRRKLDFGDYALESDPSFAVERKSIDDFVGTITQSVRWSRFQRELNRMDAAGCPKIIVVEGTYSEICNHQYSGQVNPVFVTKRICQLSLMNVQIHYTEMPGLTSYFVYYLFVNRLKEINHEN